MASAGTVSVQVKPDLTEFAAGLTEAIDALGASTLLHQYSEWLDGQGLVKRAWCGGDDRTHDELVKQFLAERNEAAVPPIDDDESDAPA